MIWFVQNAFVNYIVSIILQFQNETFSTIMSCVVEVFITSLAVYPFPIYKFLDVSPCSKQRVAVCIFGRPGIRPGMFSLRLFTELVHLQCRVSSCMFFCALLSLSFGEVFYICRSLLCRRFVSCLLMSYHGFYMWLRSWGCWCIQRFWGEFVGLRATVWCVLQTLRRICIHCCNGDMWCCWLWLFCSGFAACLHLVILFLVIVPIAKGV